MNLLKKLIQDNAISEEEATSLEYEVRSSDKKLEEIIVDKGLVAEEDLFKKKAELQGVPFKRVYPDEIDEQVLELIPQRSVEQYKMVPISKEKDVLEVGMVYPDDMEALEALKFLARQGGFSYQINLITPSDYRKVVKKYGGLKKTVTKALERFRKEEEEEEPEERRPAGEKGWGRLAEEAPISKVVDVLLRNALEGEASDIHIEPFGGRLRVRFRVLGDLYSSIFLPEEYLAPLVARVKILSNMRIDETRIPQDGRFSKEIEGRKIDFRVSTLPTGKGEKVAIRILDPEKGLRPFNKLGLEGRNLDVLKKVMDERSGLILVTGPTGSGKTTTLYASIKKLNKENVNIVTLEDPIEYFMKGINQSQVRPEIDYSFARGLRHVLRQDPDIIMVGEIRDSESASLAFHAGLTGHLVLSTLHTTGTLGVIPRLVDLGVPVYLIPVVLRVAVAQRLVRRLCDECKEKVRVDEKTKRILEEEIKDMPQKVRDSLDVSDDLHIYKAVGCRECNGRGYSGRIGSFEVLEITDSLSDVILEDSKAEDKLLEEARKQGMVTMRQDAILKALEGLTTIEEALHITKSI